jgi:hypothetical protein
MRKTEVQLRICTEDFRSAQDIVHIFNTLEQCRHAIAAKGARILDTRFDTAPDIVFNPDGTIVTVRFTIALPFECVSADLEVGLRVDDTYSPRRVSALCELKIGF